MKTARPWRLVLGAAFVATVFTGCLSKEESNTGASGDSPVSQNSPPVISGQPPASAKAGTHWSFTPNTSDPDGDNLTFAIQNKPDWASFETASGKLSGTPDAADVGSYPDIEISVTDGQAKVTLPAFSVDVVQASTSSITLSWQPPTVNEDGSTLSDLAGYKIYYGTESGNYSQAIQVNNPGLASYVVENLVPDTYYIVATSFNRDGVESEFSNEAVKQVF